jgi:hypothetical protein
MVHKGRFKVGAVGRFKNPIYSFKILRYFAFDPTIFFAFALTMLFV